MSRLVGLSSPSNRILCGLPNIPRLTFAGGVASLSIDERAAPQHPAKNTIPPDFCLTVRSASCHPFNERVTDRGSGTVSACLYPGRFSVFRLGREQG